jgi:hypothetical protein
MLQKGDIALAGGLYEVETGHVHFFEHDMMGSIPFSSTDRLFN